MHRIMEDVETIAERDYLLVFIAHELRHQMLLSHVFKTRK